MINKLLRLRWRRRRPAPEETRIDDVIGENPPGRPMFFAVDELYALTRAHRHPHRIVTAASSEAVEAIEGACGEPVAESWAYAPVSTLTGIPIYRGEREVARALDHAATWNETYPEDPIEVISIDAMIASMRALALVRQARYGPG